MTITAVVMIKGLAPGANMVIPVGPLVKAGDKIISLQEVDTNSFGGNPFGDVAVQDGNVVQTYNGDLTASTYLLTFGRID